MSFLLNHLGDFGQGVMVTLDSFPGCRRFGAPGDTARRTADQPHQDGPGCFLGLRADFPNVPLPVQMVLFVFGLPVLGIQYSLYALAAIVLCSAIRTG